jgi:hypothetical protein
MVTLAIVYEEKNGAALRVAQIRNEMLLHEAARLAIEEAESGAVALFEQDRTLGSIQKAEAEKLREVLLLLLPNLEVRSETTAFKM